MIVWEACLSFGESVSASTHGAVRLMPTFPENETKFIKFQLKPVKYNNIKIVYTE